MLSRRTKLYVSLAMSTAATTYVYCWWKDITLQYLVSKLLASTGITSVMPVEVMRKEFSTMDDVAKTVVKGHTHGTAAGDRTTARLFMNTFTKSLGLKPYAVQYSAQEQRLNQDGSRTYYWAKDLQTLPSLMELKVDTLVHMVDVDQYIDMPAFLLWHFKPILIYTFQPHFVAGSFADYHFTFDAYNQVDYKVAGGGHYIHPVWAYGFDCIIVRRYFLGLCIMAATYMVDRRLTSDNHEVILLTPLRKWVGIPAIVTYFLDGQTLQRLRVVQGKFLRLEIVSKRGIYISTGKPNQQLEATISSKHDNALSLMEKNSGIHLVVNQVETLTKLDKDQCVMLLDYHREQNFDKPMTVFPVDKSVRRYQYYPGKFDCEAKPSLVAFMSPLVEGAFAPDKCLNNEEAMVLKRVKEVTSEVVITKFLAQVIDEFVQQLNITDLIPCDVQEVYARQDRPSQRVILKRAEFLRDQRIIQAFAKAEAYMKVTPPRVISTVTGPHKRDYSCYTYALADALALKNFYAFGQTPESIANEVSNICLLSAHVLVTDYSKFDGHLSNALRLLERQVWMFAFPQHRNELSIILDNTMYLKAHATFGTTYDTGTSRCSGSPETSVMNTIDNAFITFLAWRKLNLPPDYAYKKLGIYGGDDGLTPDLPAQAANVAAKMVGQVLDVKVIERDKEGVKFLSRYYSPYVWTGMPDSCCDLFKTLSKFHTTHHITGVTNVDKLVEKCRAYSLTDANTPLIGVFVLKVCELAKRVGYTIPKEIFSELVWNSWMDVDLQYPNRNIDGWMAAYLPECLELRRYFNFLDTAQTLEQLLFTPLIYEPLPPVVAEEVVINGERVAVAPAQKPKFQPKNKVGLYSKQKFGKRKFVPNRPK